MEHRAYILSRLKNHFSTESSISIAAILCEDIPNIDSFSKIELDDVIDRLAKGEPTQYVTGVAPFYGHFFLVDNNVLIPRPETEELVYAVEKHIKSNRLESCSILDIGTGSGCIPITLNDIFPSTNVVGLDVSNSALLVANANNAKLKTNVTFRNVDFLDESLWKDLGDFEVIISNPPYIPMKEKAIMSANVLDHEPHIALFVQDTDPMLFYRKIFDYSRLQTGNKAIFMECNEFNAQEVLHLFEQCFDSEIIKDLQGKDRIVKAVSNKE